MSVFDGFGWVSPMKSRCLIPSGVSAALRVLSRLLVFCV